MTIWHVGTVSNSYSCYDGSVYGVFSNLGLATRGAMDAAKNLMKIHDGFCTVAPSYYTIHPCYHSWGYSIAIYEHYVNGYVSHLCDIEIGKMELDR